MKVLFVSHDGARTGAPLLLLWLVSWFARNSEIRPFVVLLRDGALRPEFEAICPTMAWRPPPPYRPLRERIADRLAGRASGSAPGELLEEAIQKINPELVYLNSLVIGRHLSHLSTSSRKRPFITHAHELNFTLLTESTSADVKTQLQLSDCIICCAPPVQELLVESYGFDRKRTAVVHEYLPFPGHQDLIDNLKSSTYADDIRQRITTARQQGAFIFGCSGSPIMRKGFDLYPALLKACAARFDSMNFLGLWLGCGEGSGPHLMAHMDIYRLGVHQHALLLGHMPQPLPIVNELDVFCLMSREDPYPLVVLEAAALGKPTLCFSHSGGIVDFVGEDAGIIIDYLDINQFACQLRSLAQDPRRLRSLGDQARKNVFERHTVDVAGKSILALIRTMA